MNHEPRLTDVCPAYRQWLRECELLLLAGNEPAAAYAWNRAVEEARAYRTQAERARVDA